MTFITVKFFIFFVCFLILYKLMVKNIMLQKKLLVVGNYAFYALIDIKFLICLFAISVFTWIISNAVFKKKNKILLFIGILVNVLVLFFFKYIGLFQKEGSFYKLVMPIGISFYIFEAISYMADSYNGTLTSNYSFWDALLYLGFFPTLISGPIMKARDFLPQTEYAHTITLNNFEIGIQRFTLGAFEKLVMADRLAVSVDAVYSSPSAYSGMSLLWNTITYSLQLYFDFAGYTHMAIGIATILGFNINENFNLPYLANSPSDFWKRWHISLSSWIKEYIYIPLGGNRKGTLRTYLNILITMLICGVWHGSSLNYLLWGLGHGVAQVIQKLCHNIGKPIMKHQIGKIISVVLTFITVNFLWVPFRTDNIHSTLIVFDRIIHNARGIQYYYSYTLIFAIIVVAIEIYASIKNSGNYPIKTFDLRTFKGKLVLVTMLFLILMFAYGGNNAFIYGSLF